jgi:hypothetical protein
LIIFTLLSPSLFNLPPTADPHSLIKPSFFYIHILIFVIFWCFRSRICIWEKMWYLFFWVWLFCWTYDLWLHLFSYKFRILFFMAEEHLIEYVCHVFFMYSLVEHVGWFHCVAIVKSSAINMVCRCLYCMLTYMLSNICREVV